MKNANSLTVKQLARVIAKLDGRDNDVRIADINWILEQLSDLLYHQFRTNGWEMDETFEDAVDVALFLDGKRRYIKSDK